MPTCSYCALTYQHSLIYCPNCGTDNVPPPIPTKQKPMPRAQNIPAPQKIQYIPQPQVVVIKEKRNTGINLLAWMVIMSILGICMVVFFGPLFLVHKWSSQQP